MCENSGELAEFSRRCLLGVIIGCGQGLVFNSCSSLHLASSVSRRASILQHSGTGSRVAVHGHLGQGTKGKEDKKEALEEPPQDCRSGQGTVLRKRRWIKWQLLLHGRNSRTNRRNSGLLASDSPCWSDNFIGRAFLAVRHRCSLDLVWNSERGCDLTTHDNHSIPGDQRCQERGQSAIPMNIAAMRGGEEEVGMLRRHPRVSVVQPDQKICNRSWTSSYLQNV